MTPVANAIRWDWAMIYDTTHAVLEIFEKYQRTNDHECTRKLVKFIDGRLPIWKKNKIVLPL